LFCSGGRCSGIGRRLLEDNVTPNPEWENYVKETMFPKREETPRRRLASEASQADCVQAVRFASAFRDEFVQVVTTIGSDHTPVIRDVANRVLEQCVEQGNEVCEIYLKQCLNDERCLFRLEAVWFGSFGGDHEIELACGLLVSTVNEIAVDAARRGVATIGEDEHGVYVKPNFTPWVTGIFSVGAAAGTAVTTGLYYLCQMSKVAYQPLLDNVA